MLQVKAIQGNNTLDISQYTGSFELSDNIESLGREFNFNYSNNKALDTQSTWVDLEMGNTILVYNDGNLIFQGSIIYEDRTNLSDYKYKCFDNAFYLNKNQARIQFNDITVKQAVEQLCNQEYIPCNVACDIPTKVTKIYNGEIISKIIDDLLKMATDETGKKYRREYNYGSLYINAFDNLKMIYDQEPLVGQFHTTRSIEEMANKVIVISGSEKETQVVATAQDDESIKLFGQYTHYEKIDDKKTDQAQTIADNKLKELKKVVTSCSLTLLGDDYVRSGRILQFNQPQIGLVGEYLVTNCKHSYTGSEHTMECEVKTNG